MRKTEKVANSFQLYQAKEEDWCFTGVLANSQKIILGHSLLSIQFTV